MKEKDYMTLLDKSFTIFKVLRMKDKSSLSITKILEKWIQMQEKNILILYSTNTVLILLMQFLGSVKLSMYLTNFSQLQDWKIKEGIQHKKFQFITLMLLHYLNFLKKRTEIKKFGLTRFRKVIKRKYKLEGSLATSLLWYWDCST